MLDILKIGHTLESCEVLRKLFDLRRRPLRIRIISPLIKSVQIDDFRLLNTLRRLLASGTTVTIITRNFVKKKAELLEKIESLKQELKDGRITKDCYQRLLGGYSRRLRNVEKAEFMFEELNALNASIFCQQRIHAKMIVVESKKENLALVMSANITPTGLTESIEVGVVLNDQACINKINTYVDKIIDYGGTIPYGVV